MSKQLYTARQMAAEADMAATKWFFLNEEINILHSIDVFNFAKVENVSDGKIYYVDKAFITAFPKEPEQAISLTLLGGNNSGYLENFQDTQRG